LDEQHFQVMVMLEMDVHRRDDHQEVLVLNVGEFSLQVSFPIVVHEGDRARHALGAEFLLVLDQLLTGHFGDGVRAVRKFPLRDHVIQLVEQIGRQGNAETGEAGTAAGHGERQLGERLIFGQR
jgi:hypothetical protein